MTDRELLNERKCEECGQVTMTRHWQDITFCANCGVEVGSTEADRQEHLSVGVALSPDELEQLVDGDEISLTRSVTDDRHLTINLMKAPP